MTGKHSKPSIKNKNTHRRAGGKAQGEGAAPVQPANGERKPGQLEPLKVRTDAAGIDIGSQEIAVA